MDILGKEVIHKSMGIGTVVSQEGKTLTVHFETKDMKLIYPDAFKQHLTFVDPDAAAQMADEMAKNASKIADTFKFFLAFSMFFLLWK